MGTFKSEKTLPSNPALIGTIANNIITTFQSEGYECTMTPQAFGTQISIRKGNLFKAVLGRKTALNVSLIPMGNNAISVKAEVGLFGTAVVPGIVMYFVFWPVIIVQIWGLIQQSQLDDRVIKIAESTLAYGGQSFGGNGSYNSGFNSGFNGYNGGNFNGGNNGGGFNGNGGYGNGNNGGGFNGNGGFGNNNGGGYNNGNTNSAPNNNRYGGFRQQ